MMPLNVRRYSASVTVVLHSFTYKIDRAVTCCDLRLLFLQRLRKILEPSYQLVQKLKQKRSRNSTWTGNTENVY